MDPQIKSALTSIGMIATTSIAAWAAKSGFISAGDQMNVANSLLAIGGALATIGIGYWKSRQHSQVALIAAVNSADNGVKVVSAAAPAPQVDAPAK